jgi:hypothetical protein
MGRKPRGLYLNPPANAIARAVAFTWAAKRLNEEARSRRSWPGEIRARAFELAVILEVVIAEAFSREVIWLSDECL